MSGFGIDLHVGARLLLPDGPAVVTVLERHGVCVKTATGAEEHIRWDHLVARPIIENGVAAVHVALEPWWSSLDEATQRETLIKLEAVLEILTGYRDGCPELALKGEPFYPYGEGFGVSVTQRSRAMARELSFERGVDRTLVRRVQEGELQTSAVSEEAVRDWIRRYQQGVRGLVDRRKTKGKKGFDTLDPRFLRIANEEFGVFDGGRSNVNLVEIERRILVRLKEAGADDVQLPQRLVQQYLSSRYAALGKTTRSHKSAKLRQRSGHDNYPDAHPGHLAVDVTRADNLVRDTTGRPISVEIISVISVPTKHRRRKRHLEDHALLLRRTFRIATWLAAALLLRIPPPPVRPESPNRSDRGRVHRALEPRSRKRRRLRPRPAVIRLRPTLADRPESTKPGIAPPRCLGGVRPRPSRQRGRRRLSGRRMVEAEPAQGPTRPAHPLLAHRLSQDSGTRCRSLHTYRH